MLQYMDLIERERSIPLNEPQMAGFNLFETPLREKEDLKRVVLFSDNADENVSLNSNIEITIWYS